MWRLVTGYVMILICDMNCYDMYMFFFYISLEL